VARRSIRRRNDFNGGDAMGDLMATSVKDDGQEGTRIGRFLSDRGVIILKEMRPVGAMKCNHGARISVETMILTTAKSSTRISEKSFGVRFETKDANDSESLTNLDFDETEEFAKAISYFYEVSKRISSEQRDYTEATFSTKDGIQVGFYQDVDQNQLAFFRGGRVGDLLFFRTEDLPKLRTLVDQGRAHLMKKGAGAELGPD
jgi:hypothetical protein